MIRVFSYSNSGILLGTVTAEEEIEAGYRILSETLSKKIVFGMLVLMFLGGMGLLVSYRCFTLERKCVKPEVIFAVIYTYMCLFSFLAIPIFNTPDEDHHFFRAYEISKGHLLSESVFIKNESTTISAVGRKLPKNLCADDLKDRDVSWWDIKTHWNDTITETETEFVDYANTALYAPVCYIPQSVGIAIADVFSDRPLVMAYAGRMLNCVTIGMLIFWAIKITPLGKNLMAMLALMPMSIQGANSLSADGMTLGVIFLFVGYILYLRYIKRGKMKTGEILALYVLTIFLCFCKIVYIPLCLLLFAVPQERYKNKRSWIKHIICAGGLIIVLSIGWLALATTFLDGIKADTNVDTAKQLLYILANPIKFILNFFRTMDTYTVHYIGTLLGSQMGWMNFNMPAFLLVPYLLVLAAEVFWDTDTGIVRMERGIKYLMIGVSTFIFLLIFVTLYGQWTPVGYSLIEGIQGRYFVPILFILLLAVKTQGNSTNPKSRVHWNGYACLLSCNICLFSALTVHVLTKFNQI